MRPSQLIDDLKAHGATEEQIWHILTALRSCDDPKCDERLKWRTTARIRGVLNLEGPFDVNPYALSPYDKDKRDELLTEAPSHFFYHYHDAVNAIEKLYKYNLITEQDMNHPPALAVPTPKKAVIHHKKKSTRKPSHRRVGRK